MFECFLTVDSQLLADYARYLFPPKEGTEALAVSVSHPAGALMVALAEPSAFQSVPEGDFVLRLDLPWNRNATSSLENHWCRFDKEAVARIGLALKAEFELEFAGYYRRGEALGFRKMDIVDAFILSRGLAPQTYDALHKRAYRSRQRTLEKVRKQLLRKCYYINETIDYTGLNQK